jgi:hypothetical protein
MVRITIALLAAGFCAGCDKTPTGPTSAPPTVPPSGAVTRSVEIVGPQAVPLAGEAQFRVMAQLTDGSTRDVTNEARWQAGSGDLMSISDLGLAAGRARGEVRLTAQFDGRRASKDVMVLPAGTFRLMGTVTEAHTAPGPVVGAFVEVTTGVGARLTAYTDHVGTYRLYGVSGETGLRVTKHGYHPTTQTAVVVDQSALHNIALPLIAERADVSGIYTLTLTAASTCGVGLGEGRLPEEARVREYQADVRQDGPRVAVLLSAPTFRGRAFSGRVEPGGVVFALPWHDSNDFADPAIIDRLPTSGILTAQGYVIAAISANHLAGPFHAEFSVFDPEGLWSRPLAACTSKTHQFVLSK